MALPSLVSYHHAVQ